MPRYKPYDYKQSKLVAVDYEAQLAPGTFEHALHHLVDKKLDLSIFDTSYRNDETGRRAYDPAILLKIVLFAYSKGITSSREIEWCCTANKKLKRFSLRSRPKVQGQWRLFCLVHNIEKIMNYGTVPA